MKIGISILCIAVLATSSAGFVNIQTFDSGARSLGLGNSFVAVADNTDAVFANPAGLGQLRRRQATYTYGDIDKLNGIELGWYMASLGMPLSEKLGLGLGYERLSSPEHSENGAFVSLSYQAVKRLYVGVSAKYLFSTFSPIPAAEYEGGTATASWIDVGLLWQSPFLGAQMGLLLKNVYQSSGRKADVLDREVHVGAGYRVGTQALLSVQYVRHQYEYVQYDRTKLRRGRRGWMIGGEYHLLKELVLRAGREHEFGLIEELDGRKDRVWLSVGLGLRLEYRAVGLLLDYVHSSNRGVLSPHRFSLACEF